MRSTDSFTIGMPLMTKEGFVRPASMCHSWGNSNLFQPHSAEMRMQVLRSRLRRGGLIMAMAPMSLDLMVYREGFVMSKRNSKMLDMMESGG